MNNGQGIQNLARCSCIWIDFFLKRLQSCIGRWCHTCNVDYSASKILTTRTAKKSAFIVRNAAYGCQLHLCGLPTPLTTTSTRNAINRDRSSKFIFGHKVSSRFMLISQKLSGILTNIRGNPYLVANKNSNPTVTRHIQNAHHRPGAASLI